mmetsp:Transcript_8177/g.14835  ORF Transcript_8177/g.14835 Transcript_8177/m.14835 type:complete len:989 (-) Transcript_8177:147-3113(-)|eukprot:CAMPEP_0182504252 /NCGR_PEP_ID=MMETSP1321-20130603/16855_1 /TAXON_ID=91990 /ORGANISM="Bolidomonas sp., Strain RCC1657" /LENGTH=988 /DNA_ID=CAMNT_0024709567 /DNA_START=15 /DNA_END=2981 /DNA_ORIENTATION=-
MAQSGTSPGGSPENPPSDASRIAPLSKKIGVLALLVVLSLYSMTMESPFLSAYTSPLETPIASPYNVSQHNVHAPSSPPSSAEGDSAVSQPTTTHTTPAPTPTSGDSKSVPESKSSPDSESFTDSESVPDSESVRDYSYIESDFSEFVFKHGCRILVGTHKSKNAQYVLKRSPLELAGKCGGGTFKDNFPSFCDWPVAELIASEFDKVLNLGLVPETFPTILKAKAFEDMYFGSDKCGSNKSFRINNRIKTKKSYQIFSAQTIAGELKELGREELHNVAMDVLAHGSKFHKGMIADRWNIDGERSPLSKTKIYQSICQSFVFDVLMNMNDRFASHLTLFRVLFSNLVDRERYANEVGGPIDEEISKLEPNLPKLWKQHTAGGTKYNLDNMMCNPAKGCDELVLIDNGKSLHGRSFIDPSAEGVRKLVSSTLTEPEVKLTAKKSSDQNFNFPMHFFCAFHQSFLAGLYEAARRVEYIPDHFVRTNNFFQGGETSMISRYHDWSNIKATGDESLGEATDMATFKGASIVTHHTSMSLLGHAMSNCMSCDRMRPPELQAMVVWYGSDLPKALEVLASLEQPHKAEDGGYLKLVKAIPMEALSDTDITDWCKVVYSGDLATHQSCRPSPGADSPVLVVLEDTNPVYFWSKTGNPASPPQFMNKHMKNLKDQVRQALKRNPVHMGCHSSANVEETALAIDPLRSKLAGVADLPSSRPNIAPPGGFEDMNHVMKWTNTYSGVGQQPEEGAFAGCIKAARTGIPGEIDIFTNDYFTFKTLVHAESQDKLLMRENGEKGSVKCSIPMKSGNPLIVEVRALDDFFADKNWVAEALAVADRETGIMDKMHAGMMSLYILLSYHGGKINHAQAEYIHDALKGRSVFMYNKDDTVVRVELQLSVEEIEGAEYSVKVALINFMKFHGYAFVADDFEKNSPKMPKPSRWWSGVDWKQDWDGERIVYLGMSKIRSSLERKTTTSEHEASDTALFQQNPSLRGK